MNYYFLEIDMLNVEYNVFLKKNLLFIINNNTINNNTISYIFIE